MLQVHFLVASSVGNNYPPAPEGRAPSPPTEDDDQPPPIPGRHLPDLIQNNHSLSKQEEVSTFKGRQKDIVGSIDIFILILCNMLQYFHYNYVFQWYEKNFLFIGDELIFFNNIHWSDLIPP